MTPQDKIKELKHIQQMIVDRGDADEINAKNLTTNAVARITDIKEGE